MRQQVTVKAAPAMEAKFTAYKRSPHTWLFSDDSSNESPSATRVWNSGDPASGAAITSTEGAPEHTFSATDTYTVTLTVSDAGRTSSTSQQVVAPTDQPPTANFTYADIGSNQAEFSDASADPPEDGSHPTPGTSATAVRQPKPARRTHTLHRASTREADRDRRCRLDGAEHRNDHGVLSDHQGDRHPRRARDDDRRGRAPA